MLRTALTSGGSNDGWLLDEKVFKVQSVASAVLFQSRPTVCSDGGRTGCVHMHAALRVCETLVK